MIIFQVLVMPLHEGLAISILIIQDYISVYKVLCFHKHGAFKSFLHPLMG